MPTPASQQALIGLRDLSTLEWYVITISTLYGIAIIANGVAMGLLGWRY